MSKAELELVAVTVECQCRSIPHKLMMLSYALRLSITIRCQSLVSNDIPKQLQASTNFFMTSKTQNWRTGGKCPEPVAEDVKVCPV